MSGLAARARGLASRLVPEAALAAIDRATTPHELASALAAAGIADAANAVGPGQEPGSGLAEGVERAVGRAASGELAVLARWSADRPAAIAVLLLDEDRRSLRGIVRGIAGGISGERRIAGAIPTAGLAPRVLAELAGATTLAELAAMVAERDHPLAPALAAEPGAIDLVAVELALAREVVAAAGARDPAVRAYLAQLVDGENLAALLALRARGGDLDAAQAFLAGGERLARRELVRLVAAPIDVCQRALATAFARTPLAAAVRAGTAAAVEDGVLAWQIATQARLRRLAPHGAAAALHVVLRRRAEARRLRRAAWRVAFGGAA